MTGEDLAKIGGWVLAMLTAAGAAFRWLWTRGTASRIERAQAAEAEAALVDRPFREAWRLIDRLTADVEKEATKRRELEQRLDEEIGKRRALGEVLETTRAEVRALRRELEEAEETIADLGRELGREVKRKADPPNVRSEPHLSTDPETEARSRE